MSTAKPKFEPAVFRRMGQSYTCITTNADAKYVQFIPMSSLQLEKVERRLFEEQWEEFLGYPVRRAAELYLGAGEFRDIDSKVSAQLASIRDGAPSYNFDEPVKPPLKEPQMATVAKKNPAAGKPAKTAKPVKVAAAAPAKQPAKKAAPADDATPAARGRKSNVDPTTKLTVLVKDNPKREGSSGHARFQAGYLDSKAKTVAAALEAGVTLADIAYDVKKEFIKLG